MCSVSVATVIYTSLLFQNFNKISSLKFIDGLEYKEVVGPRINTINGLVEGRILTTKAGVEYESFEGIPYAKPPTGKLRFRDPQPADKWEGILDATEVGSACTQYDALILNTYYGEEDCLYLNVFVPRTAENHSPLTTMVWIHGGGFILGEGSPEMYGPNFLVEQNVIVVTINYRLGVFGFLSLNIPEVPGNAGLKDQSLALKWVKENIQHFNGDENKITIFGESAGAVSVNYHMMSPMSRGLFDRAIIQSGAASCLWALQKDPVSVAFKLAAELGFTIDSKDEVIEFLRTIPSQQLTFATLSTSFTDSIRLSFVPTIEQIFPNSEAFITRTPQDILRSGDFQKIPLLAGLLSVEGLIFRTNSFHDSADSDAANNNYLPDLKKFVPDELIAKYGENGVDNIVTKIQQFYFPTSDKISDGLTKLYSDFLFVKEVINTVTTYAKRSSDVFYYEFNYSGSRNLFKFLSTYNYTGAAHTDELGYIFDISHLRMVPSTESDELTIERMVKMWTNFAKYGNPTPDTTEVLPIIWNPVKPSQVVCLRIDKDLKMINDPFVESVSFWKSIYEM